MGMTVKQEGPAIPTKVWDKKASASLADEAVKELVHRAFDDGKDQNDRPFKSYSAGYGVQRRKKGLSTKPDLTVTGKLKASVEVGHVTEDGFTIESSVPYAGAVDAERPFFGLSPKNEKNLQDDVEEAVREAMARSQKK